jgi:hypothetical protein
VHSNTSVAKAATMINTVQSVFGFPAIIFLTSNIDALICPNGHQANAKPKASEAEFSLVLHELFCNKLRPARNAATRQRPADLHRVNL